MAVMNTCPSPVMVTTPAMIPAIPQAAAIDNVFFAPVTRALNISFGDIR